MARLGQFYNFTVVFLQTPQGKDQQRERERERKPLAFVRSSLMIINYKVDVDVMLDVGWSRKYEYDSSVRSFVRSFVDSRSSFSWSVFVSISPPRSELSFASDGSERLSQPLSFFFLSFFLCC